MGGRSADAADGTATTAALTLAELQASLNRVLGAELPLSEPIWLSRVVGNSRQADRYVAGRIVLAGDAAHVFGLGGGLNGGLTDALNLGWKLAAEISGRAPAGLLASYHAERHAAARRTLLQSRAQHALSAGGEAGEALRELFAEISKLPGVAQHLGQLIQGSDVRYEMPDSGGHPLAGAFAPGPPAHYQRRQSPDRRADAGGAAGPAGFHPRRPGGGGGGWRGPRFRHESADAERARGRAADQARRLRRVGERPGRRRPGRGPGRGHVRLVRHHRCESTREAGFLPYTVKIPCPDSPGGQLRRCCPGA